MKKHYNVLMLLAGLALLTQSNALTAAEEPAFNLGLDNIEIPNPNQADNNDEGEVVEAEPILVDADAVLNRQLIEFITPIVQRLNTIPGRTGIIIGMNTIEYTLSKLLPLRFIVKLLSNGFIKIFEKRCGIYPYLLSNNLIAASVGYGIFKSIRMSLFFILGKNGIVPFGFNTDLITYGSFRRNTDKILISSGAYTKAECDAHFYKVALATAAACTAVYCPLAYLEHHAEKDDLLNPIKHLPVLEHPEATDCYFCLEGLASQETFAIPHQNPTVQHLAHKECYQSYLLSLEADAQPICGMCREEVKLPKAQPSLLRQTRQAILAFLA